MDTSPITSTSILVEQGGDLEKMNDATSLASFCLRVGKHENSVTEAEFRRNVMIPNVLL